MGVGCQHVHFHLVCVSSLQQQQHESPLKAGETHALLERMHLGHVFDKRLERRRNPRQQGACGIGLQSDAERAQLQQQGNAMRITIFGQCAIVIEDEVHDAQRVCHACNTFGCEGMHLEGEIGAENPVRR